MQHVDKILENETRINDDLFEDIEVGALEVDGDDDTILKEDGMQEEDDYEPFIEEKEDFLSDGNDNELQGARENLKAISGLKKY